MTFLPGRLCSTSLNTTGACILFGGNFFKVMDEVAYSRTASELAGGSGGAGVDGGCTKHQTLKRDRSVAQYIGLTRPITLISNSILLFLDSTRVALHN